MELTEESLTKLKESLVRLNGPFLSPTADGVDAGTALAMIEEITSLRLTISLMENDAMEAGERD
jgi:hypothetical protein